MGRGREKECPTLTCSSWKQMGMNMTSESRIRLPFCSQGSQRAGGIIAVSSYCCCCFCFTWQKRQELVLPCSAALSAAKVGDAGPALSRAGTSARAPSTLPYLKVMWNPFPSLPEEFYKGGAWSYSSTLHLSCLQCRKKFVKTNMLPQLKKIS